MVEKLIECQVCGKEVEIRESKQIIIKGCCSNIAVRLCEECWNKANKARENRKTI